MCAIKTKSKATKMKIKIKTKVKKEEKIIIINAVKNRRKLRLRRGISCSGSLANDRDCGAARKGDVASSPLLLLSTSMEIFTPRH